MPIPLIAGAIALGAGRALYGITRAKGQARTAKSAIERAYAAKGQDLSIAQADTRQGTNESLNARGILTAGAVGGGPTSAIASALSGKTDHPGHLNRTHEQEMYNQGVTNSLSAPNTLSGGINRGLNDAFYRERTNQNEEKGAALDAVKYGQQDAVLNSIVAGVNTGASIYSMGSGGGGAIPSLTGAPSATANTPGAVYSPGAMPNITGAMNLPVNPSFSLPASPGGSSVAEPGQSVASFNLPPVRGPQP